MAIVVVQQAASTIPSGPTSLTTAFGSTPTNGNLLVALAFTKSDAGMVGPANWTTMIDVVNSSGADTARIAYRIAASDSTGVVLTSLTDVTDLQIYEVSGCTATPADKSTSSAFVTTTNIHTGSTGTLSQATEIAFALCAIRGTVTTPSIDSGFSSNAALQNGSAGAEAVLLPAYLITSTNASLFPKYSWTTSRVAMSAIGTFKATVASSGFVPPLYWGDIDGLGHRFFKDRLAG